jgi:hypothetical protein
MRHDGDEYRRHDAECSDRNPCAMCEADEQDRYLIDAFETEQDSEAHDRPLIDAFHAAQEADILVMCGSVIPGFTGAGGWDVLVVVALPQGPPCGGEVTLVPDRDGQPAAYGTAPDLWVADGLLAKLRANAQDAQTLTRALSAIEAAAAEAIHASGIPPAPETS